MDIATLFEDSLSGLKPMFMEILGLCMPYIIALLTVSIVIPLGFDLLEKWLIGESNPLNRYVDSEESFGGRLMYDDDGELDAIAYGDFDDSEYDDLDDYDESEDYDIEYNDPVTSGQWNDDEEDDFDDD